MQHFRRGATHQCGFSCIFYRRIYVTLLRTSALIRFSGRKLIEICATTSVEVMSLALALHKIAFNCFHLRMSDVNILKNIFLLYALITCPLNGGLVRSHWLQCASRWYMPYESVAVFTGLARYVHVDSIFAKVRSILIATVDKLPSGWCFPPWERCCSLS